MVQPAAPTSSTTARGRTASLVHATAFVFTLAGAGFLLKMDIVPGELEVGAFGFFTVCLVLPAIGVWTLGMVALTMWELSERPRLPFRKRWGMASVTVVVGTFLLLWWDVPRIVGFRLSASEFDRVVASSPPEIDRLSGDQPVLTLGHFQVDRYGTDSRGGVYFRTASGPDGISPDRLSFGFVFRPNADGSPFGNARYRLGHMVGEWYWFAVSDDS